MELIFTLARKDRVQATDGDSQMTIFNDGLEDHQSIQYITKAHANDTPKNLILEGRIGDKFKITIEKFVEEEN